MCILRPSQLLSTWAISFALPPCLAAPQVTVSVAQEAFLKAASPDWGDYFASSASLSGDTLVVGASGEDSRATGVNGDQTDNCAFWAGAAYVFVRGDQGWAPQAYLKASNASGSDDSLFGKGDEFGRAVAISGDTIVVGAPGEASSAAGVNGDQSDDSAMFSGAAYVFVRTGSVWRQEAYLKASNPSGGEFMGDAFGGAVAISGDTIVVGAAFEESAGTGVDGDQSDDSAFRAGAAYVFVREGGVWRQQAYLKASNAQRNDFFGAAVAVEGDRIAVGAPLEDSSASGLGGDQDDDSEDGAGAVYLFSRTGDTWAQEAYVKASNPGAEDGFGGAVALGAERLIVGALGEGSAATGVGGDQNDDSAGMAGAVYVFERIGTAWSQSAYLKASNPDASDVFGVRVAVSGDRILVGAYGESSSASGVDGDQGDNSQPSSGAAYLFDRRGPGWVQAAYIKASNPGLGDGFGSVALSGRTIAVGAPQEGGEVGAVYTFRIEQTVGSNYCTGAPNSTGQGGQLEMRGSLAVSENDLELCASSLPADRIGVFLYGDQQQQVPMGDGFACVGNARTFRRPVRIDATGKAARSVDFASEPALSDITPTIPSRWNFQFWYRDGVSSNFTEAVSADFLN